MIRKSLQEYIEQEVIPSYAAFDKAHREDHALMVIDRALAMGKAFEIDEEMLFAAAACHDLGLAVDRKTHHFESGKIIRSDKRLREWFTPQQIETIAQAAEDHRASSNHEPRSIYGRIVAEADRYIDPVTIIQRTVQYGLDNYPEKSREEHFRRMKAHLFEKYGRSGYLKLWFPDSPNAHRLEELRRIMENETLLRQQFDLWI